MREAANFLNARIEGQTVSSIRSQLEADIETRRREIDDLASGLIDSGLAVWDGSGDNSARLIVRGRSNLLSESQESEDLDRIRQLFDDLERKRDITEFLELTEDGEACAFSSGQRTSCSHFRVPLSWCLPI